MDDAIAWWKTHWASFPLLSKMARKYFSTPGTSVPTERLFSKAGEIISAKRNRLTSEHVNMFLFLNKYSNSGVSSDSTATTFCNHNYPFKTKLINIIIISFLVCIIINVTSLFVINKCLSLINNKFDAVSKDVDDLKSNREIHRRSRSRSRVRLVTPRLGIIKTHYALM